MAYKESSPIVKLLILDAVVWAGWRYGLPWLQQQEITAKTRPCKADPITATT